MWAVACGWDGARVLAHTALGPRHLSFFLSLSPLQREAVGYDPSRMLAPRATHDAAQPPRTRRLSSEDEASAERPAGRSAADRLAEHLSGAQPMDVDALPPGGAQGLSARDPPPPQQQQQQAASAVGGGSVGGGGGAGGARQASSDSEDSYASAELVSRMRATAARTADLFAAAEAVLRQPAPPQPAETPQPDPSAGDGSWPAGLAATPDRRLDLLFGAVAMPAASQQWQPGSAAGAGGGADFALDTAEGFRMRLPATPSPTSSKENEGARLTDKCCLAPS